MALCSLLMLHCSDGLLPAESGSRYGECQNPKGSAVKFCQGAVYWTSYSPTQFNYDREHLERAKMPSSLSLKALQKSANFIRPDWNGLNVLLLRAALDLVLVPMSDTGIESAKFLYFIGADDLILDKIPSNAFVVYQGHHGDRNAYHANIVFPSSALTEKEGTYANAEGHTQQTIHAVPTVGDARDDWKIIRALSEEAGVRLPYDSFFDIQERMDTVAPNFLSMDEREPATVSSLIKPEP
ncbi:hypothetical protein Cgig2_024964 [Carnegiea gigantea]|uniref:Molybdopterin oxidoreductase domain-containing protein n=1 Tax=Carnegiea gigantea TaxID=171969 RepID=A0A9Q1Q4X1_9CARY|nr:hypothetical protein Cgig2_024964 [Carnegiea gigantea]